MSTEDPSSFPFPMWQRESKEQFLNFKMSPAEGVEERPPTEEVKMLIEKMSKYYTLIQAWVPV